MKKLYIYLLLSFVCFFGFAINVKADYKTVCTYENVYKKGSHQYNHSVEVMYDKDKNKFKIIYQPITNFVDDGMHFLEFNDNDTSIMPSEAYSNIKKNMCPVSSIKINPSLEGNKKRVCFFEDCGHKWIEGFYEEGATGSRYIGNPKMKTKKNVGLTEKKYTVNVSGKSYSSGNTFKYNIQDNGNCGIHVYLEGIKCKEKYLCKPPLNVLFKYDSSSGRLNISYNTSSVPNAKYTDISASDTDISFKAPSTDSLFQVFFTTNTYFEDVDSEFKINTRSEFDEKFLDKWSSTGKCPASSMEVVRLNSQDLNNFLLSYNGIKEHLKEKNNTIANTDKENQLVDLDTWNYDWAHWYDKDNEYNNCESLIGDKIIATINDILLYVRILIPLLLIGLGVADFVKAMISPDETAMKKAQNKFIKRLLIAAVIFLIPSLVNLLFDLVNGVWAHINNSACNIWN